MRGWKLRFAALAGGIVLAVSAGQATAQDRTLILREGGAQRFTAPGNTQGPTLDSRSGTIRFGDGVQGARPAQGTATGDAYRSGAGSRGNQSQGFQRTPCIALFGRC